ncbi:MAG: SagB/ThcOx family dehydrogenase [Crenarchaeota archaeon]|nr:SagB/ThcOx family dehydrogenase [Thermoproteota archaeon]
MPKRIPLPLPKIRRDSMPIEIALAARRSIRKYRKGEAITLEQLSQLLWACYGVSDPSRRFLTTPSAGATYPLEIYVAVYPGGVSADWGFVDPGSYRYDPYSHSLELVKEGDTRYKLFKACLDQPWVLDASVAIVIGAVYERTTSYYGSRGVRYVHFEVGHAGQNIYLEATALGLGTVAIGAFYDDEVSSIMGLPPSVKPLYIFVVGVPETQPSVKESEISSFILANRKE